MASFEVVITLEANKKVLEVLKVDIKDLKSTLSSIYLNHSNESLQFFKLCDI